MRRYLVLLFFFCFGASASESIIVKDILTSCGAKGTKAHVMASMVGCRYGSTGTVVKVYPDRFSRHPTLVSFDVVLFHNAEVVKNYDAHLAYIGSCNEYMHSDGSCTSEPEKEPEPEPHKCPEAGTFYKRLMGGDSIAGFSTCLPSNCVITIQKADLHMCYPESDGTSRCAWDLFYTGQQCTYDPDKAGLKPPEYEWPDKPAEKPDPEAPDITDLPDSGGGGAAVEGNGKLDGIGKTLDGIKCELDDDCEGEGKEKPTAKADCEKSIFECKGDIIQCALLKIEYEESCPTEQLAELKDSMNKLFATDRTDELVDKDVLDFSKIDSKYLSNGVSFGNATCPASESVTINHFAGSTSVEISYEPACHYAQIAAPIHVILAWVAGLLLIGRTQGAF
ncbi:hypothetical protein FC650_13350 [Vibrio natriegens]|uniref:virulence factor TspB C-terminal domain-related protein n=1 Tax=Vibrio natriegens TaxID=691 RepID=UPI001594D37B|nr:virulence factor TspB C-terminal domain-related protein [Vibrio natriegens]NVC94607.1 hypothetical protein [Vibrio natriegens]